MRKDRHNITDITTTERTEGRTEQQKEGKTSRNKEHTKERNKGQRNTTADRTETKQ